MKTFAAALLALALIGGPALANEPEKTPEESGTAPDPAPVTDQMPSFEPSDPGGHHWLAEIVDSVFSVGPAEFFALDLPADPEGARATHLSGTVNVADRKGDIIVRLFKSADYQNWLKKKGGDKAAPLWTSKRARSISLDHDLPQGTRLVLLLDNGYSVRTPKRVRTQLQIQYEQFGVAAAGVATPEAVTPKADDLIVPRSNTEEEIPPPPPPPPDASGQ